MTQTDETFRYYYVDTGPGLLPVPVSLVVSVSNQEKNQISFVASLLSSTENNELAASDTTRIELVRMEDSIDPKVPFVAYSKLVMVTEVNGLEVYRFRVSSNEDILSSLNNTCFDRTLVGKIDVQIFSEDCELYERIFSGFLRY